MPPIIGDNVGLNYPLVGIISFKKRSLSVTEVECLGVDFGLVRDKIFDLVEDFVAVVV